METYKPEELTEALRAINSIIHKCEKAQEKFPEGNSQHTLLQNRLKAMYISKALITEALSKIKLNAEPQTAFDDNCNSELLLSHLDQLHTTDLGAERIRKNLRLDTDDLVGWCREKIKAANVSIIRKGKNWYITVDGCEITVNAYSYTIITAHRRA
jgi:hypothetical protein